ncbi:RNA polymerase sigma factor [Opitutus terrae]|uniref:RNA polymerase, sigma-24 subunit, ECF subfamily n=1 Tax=Opitutus terrae (strain DSM 11246 / JCM 15787 / PB90-1) TaxID=452637 RepID=B1ZTK0_OPITP|nr:RNA polymerase sigma factor [Opitutus terrae]ACB73945.1 RNA polymerase, sigma-24 subunit, ECF subfamily [Opitutus terrae PB90-1]
MPDPGPTDFGAFYRATVIPLRRYLARMLGNRSDAQDLAHDAYARIYAAFEGERIDAPRAFLFTTARRLALNQLQRRRIAPVREVDGKLIELAPAQGPGVERVVMARQEWARLETAIAALPPGCRSVLLLCKVEGLSHAEIGARLGIAVSTVEKQHARALRLLRAAVQDDAAVGRGKNDSNVEGGRAAGL